MVMSAIAYALEPVFWKTIKYGALELMAIEVSDAEQHCNEHCQTHHHVQDETPPHCAGNVQRCVLDFFS
jgi:hypothetical protein